MASYLCAIRTNYFRVTEEEKFKNLIDEFLSGSCEVFTRTDVNSNKLVGFGSDENNNWPEDETGFVSGLQECLAEDDSIIVLEVGHEKLRYLVGTATIITRSSIETIDLTSLAISKAAEMLGNPDYTTCCEY